MKIKQVPNKFFIFLLPFFKKHKSKSYIELGFGIGDVFLPLITKALGHAVGCNYLRR